LNVVVPSEFRGGPPFPDNPRDRQGWEQFWSATLEPARLDISRGDRSLLRDLIRSFRHALRAAWPRQTAFTRKRSPELHIALLRANWSDPAHVQEDMPLFKQFGVRTILFAGNGISVMPYVFAHCGFEAVAARFYQWLAPGGLLIVESQHHLSVLFGGYLSGAADGIEEYFEAAGFLFHLKEAYLWQNEQYARWRQQPEEVRYRTQGAIAEGFNQRAEVLRAVDFEQVRQGRKLVIFRSSA
jgi:hypothetical protein